jgi:hypothetical protein
MLSDDPISSAGCPYSCVKRAPHAFAYADDIGTARAISQGRLHIVILSVKGETCRVSADTLTNFVKLPILLFSNDVTFYFQVTVTITLSNLLLDSVRETAYTM